MIEHGPYGTDRPSVAGSDNMKRLWSLVPVFVAAAALGPGVPGAVAATQIPLATTSSPQTGSFTPSGSGDATQVEFPGQLDTASGPGPYPGSIVDRSLSTGVGKGVAVASGRKAKSSPQFVTGFDGLNHYDQRYARGGNQFSIEPPDQGMCVGHGDVVEVVNDVFNVYNSSGQSLLPDNTATNIVSGHPRNVDNAVDLNSFLGYPPAINRSTGIRGPEVTDASCIYDAQTGHFFLVALTLESFPTGGFTTANHLDLAVSQTSDPTGAWNIYRLDVTNDGSNPSAANACPCLGDYPHIGADANGVYLTTNSYPWNGNGFDGAQIYAFSKAQLAAGAASVNMVHFDTFGAVNAPNAEGETTQPGFTLWPSQSPGADSFSAANNGSEFFLSSNATSEAQEPVSGAPGPGTSKQLIVWTLSNTASLASTPDLKLSNRIISVGQYGIPPKQEQPGSGSAPGISAPQGHCINDTTTTTIAGLGCWRLLVGPPPHHEVVSRPDSNDSRMQQVTYANGKLWGALDTALAPSLSSENRAGIEWFIINPSNASVTLEGYLGAAGHDFTYPAIGVTSSGRGVMAFTDTGDSTDPSAAFAPIDASLGVGSYSDLATGAAPDDGFTSYAAQVGAPPRTRWGDYGAAAVDGKSVWIASEYIGGSCAYTDWGGPFFAGGSGDNLLGTCGGASHGPGVRSALANWSTRISELIP
jgi:hypothetical protein